MKVLIGLGNPGKQYSKTKHNFGFWIIDALAKRCSLKFREGKGNYIFAKKRDIFFVKPTTYMNNSGIAISELCNYYKFIHEDLLVIYDDIDLLLGNFKYKKYGGSGGHKGVESIIYQLGSESFNRLRIGILTEESVKPLENYVLSSFSKKYNEEINNIIDITCESIKYYFNNNIEDTMNKYNKKRKE